MSLLLRRHAAPRAKAGDVAAIQSIRQQADSLRSTTDEQLRQQADQLRAAKSPLSAVVQPAFALIHEAVRRTLGLKLYDVQLLAGLAMARGAVAEMQTGEGKTLAASLPAFIFSLAGRGVHVATPNAYLAQRDARLLQPAFALLGCTVGLLPERAAAQQKREAYACDVTYATGYELGFDYLRDRLAEMASARGGLGLRHRRLLRGEQVQPERLQRPLACAIIDEIDSVLIDEACTPLVLAESAGQQADDYRAHQLARQLAMELAEGADFQIDAPQRQIQITDAGWARIHDHLAGRQIGALLRPWIDYVRQALFAEHLLACDIDYVLQDDRVLLVDEFTGRIFADRSWQDGLHQAVEAKEGLPIRAPSRTLARITRQRFFRLYGTICGMTGTAYISRREFAREYGLRIERIPPAQPCRRVELPDRYFTSAQAKWQAIVQEVQTRHAAGQPILIGSRTIENSLCLAQRLAAAGMAFRLLNGRQDEAEADVIAQAGRRGAVTIATNMAGRGTDIRLGEGVAALGGLHLIGMERHESRRVDRQLIGRAARQGDPGSAQFFVSAEDPLLLRLAPRLIRRMVASAHSDGEIRVDLSRQVRAAQRKAEALAYAHRRRLVAFDDWLIRPRP
jgi:preprotein translocase subunit SecA